MTRRLVVTLLGTILATLLVAGAVTFGLARWQAHQTTEDRLREQAETIVQTMLAPATDATGRQLVQTRAVLRELRAALRLNGIEFVRIGPTGITAGALPDGVHASDLDLTTLRGGQTVTGSHGSLVFAAAPELVGRQTVAAIVTANTTTGLATATKWFLLAALVTVALGAVIPVVVGRRLGRPVRDADTVARRIAAGDLAARLPEPPAGDRDELADLSRSLNTMAAELERARLLDQQFLLSISHDLRTPLTSIRGYAEAITDGAVSEPAAAAAVISAEAERLERLVAELLTLARLDAHAFSLHPVPHDVRQPVGDAVRAFAPTAVRAHLTITLESGPPAIVIGDPERVRQVLANVLENAAKYARSSITVGVVPGPTMTAVRVDDDGPGISPDDLPHVFERLYVSRRHPVRAEVGSGLGLAIVHQLAVAMGGDAAAGVAPTGGARIEVRLPTAEPLVIPPPASTIGAPSAV